MDVRVSEILQKTIGETMAARNTPKHQEFSFTLEKLSEEGLKGRLEILIDQIGLQGERINRHMDLGDLKHYRNLISDFINEVVTHSHEFSRENYLDRRGRHRVYGIVRVVNQELDELAQELLKSEKNRLAILDKTGQIQGLLLDLIA
ncbi:MAG: YaaR family protein [Defluviitaleaceae bacterium]|nr:YaaR family protein [Defluviitaleaceae bacterium]